MYWRGYTNGIWANKKLFYSQRQELLTHFWWRLVECAWTQQGFIGNCAPVRREMQLWLTEDKGVPLLQHLQGRQESSHLMSSQAGQGWGAFVACFSLCCFVWSTAHRCLRSPLWDVVYCANKGNSRLTSVVILCMCLPFNPWNAPYLWKVPNNFRIEQVIVLSPRVWF